MKKIHHITSQLTSTLSRKFHFKTNILKFGRIKLAPSAWPQSWKVITYKAYPRFEQVLLPEPRIKQYDLIDTLLRRKSKRTYGNKSLTKEELSDLLYFSAGITQYLSKTQLTTRFYPSAGGRYPIEIYPFIFNTKGIPIGGYHYHVKTHSLEKILDEKLAKNIYKYIDQDWIISAGLVIICTAVFDRTEEKYGSRGYRHILTEYGHIAQNFYLLSTALGIGCCSIGGFIDKKINQLLDLDFEDEGIIGMITFGKEKL